MLSAGDFRALRHSGIPAFDRDCLARGEVLFGVFVIGLVDNFLRPILVGRDTRLPDYVVLVATFGGIAMLGASGFVIGPIAAALCIAGWNMFEVDFGQTETTDAALSGVLRLR